MRQSSGCGVADQHPNERHQKCPDNRQGHQQRTIETSAELRPTPTKSTCSRRRTPRTPPGQIDNHPLPHTAERSTSLSDAPHTSLEHPTSGHQHIDHQNHTHHACQPAHATSPKPNTTRITIAEKHSTPPQRVRRGAEERGQSLQIGIRHQGSGVRHEEELVRGEEWGGRGKEAEGMQSGREGGRGRGGRGGGGVRRRGRAIRCRGLGYRGPTAPCYPVAASSSSNDADNHADHRHRTAPETQSSLSDRVRGCVRRSARGSSA